MVVLALDPNQLSQIWGHEAEASVNAHMLPFSSFFISIMIRPFFLGTLEWTLLSKALSFLPIFFNLTFFSLCLLLIFLSSLFPSWRPLLSLLAFSSRVKSQLLLPSDSISRWARAPETLALFVAAWMRNGKWCGIHLCGRQTDTNSLEPTSPTHAGVLMGKGLCLCPVTHNPFGGCKSLFFKAFSLLQQGQKKRLETNNSKIISGHRRAK